MTGTQTPARRRAWLRGRTAETAAAWLLRAKGYRIVARRVRTARGEIDLIARRGPVLAFVEVKARASHAQAVAAVTPFQARRVVAAAQIWLARERESGACRFDIITVCGVFNLRHLPNAFGEDLF